MNLNKTQIAEVYETMENFENEMNAVFDFDTDDECYIHFFEADLLEDEDDIIDDVKTIFKEMGYNPTLEMDYDTGYEDLEHTLRIYL